MAWGGSPPPGKKLPLNQDGKAQSSQVQCAACATSPGKRVSKKASGGLSCGVLVRGPFLLLLVAALAAQSLWTFRAGFPHLSTCHHAPPSNSTRTVPTSHTKSLPPMRIEGQLCSTPQLERVRQKMRDVVLIINFNDGDTPRKMAAFLRKLYGRFFLSVVLIGPQEIPHLDVEARSYNPWRKRWNFAYFHFPAVVARFPQAAGFLWMNSEIVLNYLQLEHADTDKLWLPDTPRCWKGHKSGCEVGLGNVKDAAPCRCQGYVPFSDKSQATVKDSWSPTKWHKQLVRTAFGNLDDRFQLQHNRSIAPYYGQYQKRTVDIFYVPKRLAMKLAFQAMPPFVEAGVWSEVAIPITFFAVEHPSKYDPILRTVDFEWGTTAHQHPEMFWNNSQVAFHYRRQKSKQGKVDLLTVLSRFDRCVRFPLQTLRASLETELEQGRRDTKRGGSAKKV